MPNKVTTNKRLSASTPVTEIANSTQFTIAHVKGKFKELIEQLKQCGLITEENYTALLMCYFRINQKATISQSDIEELKAHISKFSSINPNATLRLMGYLFNTEASNSKENYLILKMLAHFSKQGLTIIPPGEYVTANIYQSILNNISSVLIGKDPSVLQAELITPILSTFKLIDYSFSKAPESITVYSAGIISKSTIKNLASQLKVKFKDDSVENFFKTIDEINKEFNQNKIHYLSNLNQFDSLKATLLNSNPHIAFEGNTIGNVPITFINTQSNDKLEQNTTISIYCLGSSSGACQVVHSQETNPNKPIVTTSVDNAHITTNTSPSANTESKTTPTLSSATKLSNTKVMPPQLKDNLFVQMHERFTSISLFNGHREAQLADFAYMVAILKRAIITTPRTEKSLGSYNPLYIKLNATDDTSTEFKNILALIQSLIDNNTIESKGTYWKLRNKLINKPDTFFTEDEQSSKLENDFKQYYHFYYSQKNNTAGANPEESFYANISSRYSHQAIIDAVNQAEQKGKTIVETKFHHV